MPADTASPQSPARAAVQRALTLTGSVSAMNSAPTIRAAALTTRLSASHKVRGTWGWDGEWGWGPLYGWRPDPPCRLAVTRGDVFTMPEDDYIYEFIKETKDNASLNAQPQSPRVDQNSSLTPTSQMEQGPVFNPETEAAPLKETQMPEGGTSGLEATDLSPQITDQGMLLAEEELCSGKPFDAFTDLKNGSLFAFRGDPRGWAWQ